MRYNCPRVRRDERSADRLTGHRLNLLTRIHAVIRDEGARFSTSNDEYRRRLFFLSSRRELFPHPLSDSTKLSGYFLLFQLPAKKAI